MEEGNDNASETAATGWRSPSPQHGVKELTQHAQENKPAPETPADPLAPAPPPAPTPAPPPAPTTPPSAPAPATNQLDSDDDSTVISSDAGPARILRVHLTKRQRQTMRVSNGKLQPPAGTTTTGRVTAPVGVTQLGHPQWQVQRSPHPTLPVPQGSIPSRSASLELSAQEQQRPGTASRWGGVVDDEDFEDCISSVVIGSPHPSQPTLRYKGAAGAGKDFPGSAHHGSPPLTPYSQCTVSVAAWLQAGGATLLPLAGSMEPAYPGEGDGGDHALVPPPTPAAEWAGVTLDTSEFTEHVEQQQAGSVVAVPTRTPAATRRSSLQEDQDIQFFNTDAKLDDDTARPGDSTAVQRPPAPQARQVRLSIPNSMVYLSSASVGRRNSSAPSEYSSGYKNGKKPIPARRPATTALTQRPHTQGSVFLDPSMHSSTLSAPSLESQPPGALRDSAGAGASPLPMRHDALRGTAVRPVVRQGGIVLPHDRLTAADVEMARALDRLAAAEAEELAAAQQAYEDHLDAQVASRLDAMRQEEAHRQAEGGGSNQDDGDDAGDARPASPGAGGYFEAAATISSRRANKVGGGFEARSPQHSSPGSSPPSSKGKAGDEAQSGGGAPRQHHRPRRRRHRHPLHAKPQTIAMHIQAMTAQPYPLQQQQQQRSGSISISKRPRRRQMPRFRGSVVGASGSLESLHSYDGGQGSPSPWRRDTGGRGPSIASAILPSTRSRAPSARSATLAAKARPPITLAIDVGAPVEPRVVRHHNVSVPRSASAATAMGPSTLETDVVAAAAAAGSVPQPPQSPESCSLASPVHSFAGTLTDTSLEQPAQQQDKGKGKGERRLSASYVSVPPPVSVTPTHAGDSVIESAGSGLSPIAMRGTGRRSSKLGGAAIIGSGIGVGTPASLRPTNDTLLRAGQRWRRQHAPTISSAAARARLPRVLDGFFSQEDASKQSTPWLTSTVLRRLDGGSNHGGSAGGGDGIVLEGDDDTTTAPTEVAGAPEVAAEVPDTAQLRGGASMDFSLKHAHAPKHPSGKKPLKPAATLVNAHKAALRVPGSDVLGPETDTKAMPRVAAPWQPTAADGWRSRDSEPTRAPHQRSRLQTPVGSLPPWVVHDPLPQYPPQDPSKPKPQPPQVQEEQQVRRAVGTPAVVEPGQPARRRSSSSAVSYDSWDVPPPPPTTAAPRATTAPGGVRARLGDGSGSNRRRQTTAAAAARALADVPPFVSGGLVLGDRGNVTHTTGAFPSARAVESPLATAFVPLQLSPGAVRPRLEASPSPKQAEASLEPLWRRNVEVLTRGDTAPSVKVKLKELSNVLPSPGRERQQLSLPATKAAPRHILLNPRAALRGGSGVPGGVAQRAAVAGKLLGSPKDSLRTLGGWATNEATISETWPGGMHHVVAGAERVPSFRNVLGVDRSASVRPESVVAVAGGKR